MEGWNEEEREWLMKTSEAELFERIFAGFERVDGMKKGERVRNGFGAFRKWVGVGKDEREKGYMDEERRSRLIFRVIKKLL